MPLRLEPLEPRDTASVTVYTFEVPTVPGSGPPAHARAIVGEPQHSPGHVVETPGRWAIILAGA